MKANCINDAKLSEQAFAHARLVLLAAFEKLFPEASRFEGDVPSQNL